MKILQVNILGKEKSTGRNTFEIFKAINKSGHEGFVAYGRGNHNEKNYYRIGNSFSYYVHNILSRVTGLQGYYSYFSTKNFLKYIKQISPDIIHIQSLHSNYLNLPLFFNFLKKSKIPVVLHLHDCWNFTGKCAHYTKNECYKWKNGCKNCLKEVITQYPKSYYFDNTSKMYKDKKRWLTELDNVIIIGVSNWISEQAKMSFFYEKKIETIYNWIDREIFYPREDNILKKYNADEDKFTIIGVSADWVEGTPRFEDFIKLSKKISKDFQIILVGNSKVKKIPKNIIHIPFVENTDELAKLYSAADVYVHMSIEDTFGKVIAEAMGCGTPAIVYNSTALPELIKNNCGYVVEKHNIDEVYEAIKKIKLFRKNYFREYCLKNVEENFDYENNMKKLIKLYEELKLNS